MRRSRGLPIAALTVVVLLQAGCAKQAAEPKPAPSDSRAAAAPTATPAPSPEPGLHVIDEHQFAELLQAHRGKVVLVDFWATWCVECLELMPHTVELQEELGDEGLQVMLIGLDAPEDRRETAANLLAKNGVTFDSFMSEYGGDPKSAEAFEIESAALPNIKLYDRQGVLRKVFSSGRMPPEPFEAEDIEKAVRELLAEE